MRATCLRAAGQYLCEGDLPEGGGPLDQGEAGAGQQRHSGKYSINKYIMLIVKSLFLVCQAHRPVFQLAILP